MENFFGQKTILVVDDEKSVRESLNKVLSKEGYRVLEAESGEEALSVCRKEFVNLVLTDLKMPEMDGLELLKALKLLQPDVAVVMMTAYGTIEKAVESMKEGASDFILKPFKRFELEKSLSKGLEHQTLLLENRYLKQQLESTGQKLLNIIGTSPAMRKVLTLVEQIAPSTATVLILGESGTGKGVIAETIHRASDRKEKPFVTLSCAAIPETLLEAELFGYEKGAFTGAAARKLGRFEMADGGTLFLDEVGEIPPAIQVKLLRILQDGTFERLGGTKTLAVDVRLIAATNTDLAKAVEEKKFREDLYYRLNVITVTLPPLRERTEDIPLLAYHFLKMYTLKNKKNIQGISQTALDLLLGYHWPGNVRELENTMERAVVLARKKIILPEDLPPHINKAGKIAESITIPIGMPMEEVKNKVIQETLRTTKGDKTLAAKILGITSRTIYRKVGKSGSQSEGE
ncbi:MAG: Two component, sigma54 specific, transcriptional regulator, Fis family [candidate division Zixibacteria bacterium RBG-1]|nr:MAG: Two component, sigma54 specific, transcriptional regulator, Fis family [candidate division Zixibacteria bacterium RBG-1]OGC83681.1 MAG: Fis family transcriptional regulator [candidate division Zixibacteria bacterium RBG_19FT_COMBO_42_43]